MALLLVLVVLVLVATLSTEIAVSARTHWKLADHSMNEFLLRSVVDGRRHILLAALRFDQTNGDGVDTEADEWAWKNHEKLSSWGEASGETTDPGRDPEEETTVKYRNRDVKLTAWCEDERSKLNLRGLLEPEDSPMFKNTRDTLVRLIDVYRDRWNELDLSDSDASEMVDQLVEWYRERENTDENPVHDEARGRLLSVDDLLRVPGGKWTIERLYDVRDPEQTERGEFRRTVGVVDEDLTDDEDEDEDLLEDRNWERQNGVPGLLRYVTVWNEPREARGSLRVNINTASSTLILLEGADEDLAKAILERRRQGGGDDGSGTGGTGSTAANTATASYFKSKADLSKVEGFGDGWEAKHPRLNALAEVKSSVYSLRIVATVVNATVEDRDDEEGGSRDVLAAYQYREVVQRTQQGFVSLFAERRQDPLLSEVEE
jgi:type II secretory pathway component PulK